jgi:hypothetical protein
MAKTIEKISEEEYNLAIKVIEKYKIQRREEIIEEQKQCNHENIYRREYDEDHLRTTCRKCFYEWDDYFDDVLIKNNNVSLLTSGKFEMTDKDRENWRQYIARLNCKDNLELNNL